MSYGSWSHMAIALVIWFAYSAPNSVHQFVVMVATIVEPAICLAKRVGFFAGSDQITLGREATDNVAFIFTAGEITSWFFTHLFHLLQHGVRLQLAGYSPLSTAPPHSLPI